MMVFYKDSEVEPQLGDVVRDRVGDELIVGFIDLEKRKRMFTDCSDNGVLGLNNPEKFEFIRRGEAPAISNNLKQFRTY